ncbi:conserved domain protein [Bacillus cereus ATCC 10987]|uniref:Conserved domain protein n=3 Tax=Bacillus cereus group TaxID=86661 RepID=Q72Y04_BACC1|nr:conserved domain protein [Bacillus cereus ATCC 10987]
MTCDTSGLIMMVIRSMKIKGEYKMKNKYVVAISFMILAIITLAIHASNSKVGANGFLEEPFFFLVPISYVLFFSGIGVLLFGFITSKLKKGNR